MENRQREFVLRCDLLFGSLRSPGANKKEYLKCKKLHMWPHNSSRIDGDIRRLPSTNSWTQVHIYQWLITFYFSRGGAGVSAQGGVAVRVL